MPKKLINAAEDAGTGREQDAACQQLLDLVAKLLARKWLWASGKEMKTNSKAKTRRTTPS